MSKYELKEISLNGNKKLINACKKAGLKVYNPKGDWNGYGYAKLPMVAVITSLSDMRKFNKLKKDVENTKTEIKSEEEKMNDWAKRLAKLTGITLDEAQEIAQEKIEYKQEQIEKVEERQYEKYSVRREKLIKKMKRENPLRRIEGEEHAQAILTASNRHNYTNYEELLDIAREKAKYSEIDKGEVKDYARREYY